MYGYSPCGFGFGGSFIACIVVIFIILCLFGFGGYGGSRCGACC